MANTLTGRLVSACGTRFAERPLETADNIIGPLADFDDDGRAEIQATSPWGVGILTVSGDSLTFLVMAPNGTSLAVDWQLDTTRDAFGPLADHEGDGRPECLITSPLCIGLLKVSGGALMTMMIAPNGTRFGNVLFNSPDDVMGPAATYLGGRQAALQVSSA